MIIGAVTPNGSEATIDLMVRGPQGSEYTAVAVVDTGFNGWLTLPSVIVEDLQLARRGSVLSVLADGSEVVADIYEGTVMWDGQPREVAVIATGGAPLAGMALLMGHELLVQVKGGGQVRIAALESA